MGDDPVGIAITPDGTTAYVVNYGSNNVTPINTATNTTEPNIVLPSGAESPFGIAITPDGTTAYIANFTSNNLTPVDTASGTAGNNIALPAGAESPYAIAITPNGEEAYVADFTSNNLTSIDLATGAGVNIAALSGSLLEAQRIAITPDQAPVAHLTVTPGEVGQATAFDASASTVAYGSIASYAWNFGDGSTATTTAPVTTHTYTSVGTFTATVTETSSENLDHCSLHGTDHEPKRWAAGDRHLERHCDRTSGIGRPLGASRWPRPGRRRIDLTETLTVVNHGPGPASNLFERDCHPGSTRSRRCWPDQPLGPASLLNHRSLALARPSAICCPCVLVPMSTGRYCSLREVSLGCRIPIRSTILHSASFGS